jgi:hypothetical protein
VPPPVVASSGKSGVRLSARFSEWLMGLPAGWLDVPGVSESAQLTMAGNAVVPAQAAEAVRRLLADELPGDGGRPRALGSAPTRGITSLRLSRAWMGLSVLVGSLSA